MLINKHLSVKSFNSHESSRYVGVPPLGMKITDEFDTLWQVVFAMSPEVKLNKTRDLNKRGGAIYTNERGDRAVQTSSRAGVRVYSTQGKRIGPVFKSIEKAERHLAKMGK